MEAFEPLPCVTTAQPSSFEAPEALLRGDVVLARIHHCSHHVKYRGIQGETARCCGTCVSAVRCRRVAHDVEDRKDHAEPARDEVVSAFGEGLSEIRLLARVVGRNGDRPISRHRTAGMDKAAPGAARPGSRSCFPSALLNLLLRNLPTGLSQEAPKAKTKASLFG